jgi:hypothetical protein
MEHYFYEENVLLDLRYLVSAERGSEEAESEEFLIACLLEVGHTPQRMLLFFSDWELRNLTFAKLVAMHQAWTKWSHRHETYPHDDEEEHN